MSEENKKPESVGARIRALIEPALEDPRRPELQLKKLDEIFNAMAPRLPKIMEGEINNFENAVKAETDRKPENRNPMIIDALTQIGPNGESLYSPIKKFGLPISTTFTEFAAADINELPGYIKLHEAARELDVSLKLIGVTAEETKGSGGLGMPAVLIVDGSKSYTDGALEGARLYPNLPPRKVDFGRRGNDFDL
ncbi:MAG: hypothetical protein RBS08_00920 [Bdellovibrionales bacterium]|jgi:hypothetical protein|nr:hypothetical protein [Bdellovibrionales bacterium]